MLLFCAHSILFLLLLLFWFENVSWLTVHFIAKRQIVSKRERASTQIPFSTVCVCVCLRSKGKQLSRKIAKPCVTNNNGFFFFQDTFECLKKEEVKKKNKIKRFGEISHQVWNHVSNIQHKMLLSENTLFVICRFAIPIVCPIWCLRSSCMRWIDKQKKKNENRFFFVKYFESFDRYIDIIIHFITING